MNIGVSWNVDTLTILRNHIISALGLSRVSNPDLGSSFLEAPNLTKVQWLNLQLRISCLSPQLLSDLLKRKRGNHLKWGEGTSAPLLDSFYACNLGFLEHQSCWDITAPLRPVSLTQLEAEHPMEHMLKCETARTQRPNFTFQDWQEADIWQIPRKMLKNSFRADTRERKKVVVLKAEIWVSKRPKIGCCSIRFFRFTIGDMLMYSWAFA